MNIRETFITFQEINPVAIRVDKHLQEIDGFIRANKEKLSIVYLCASDISTKVAEFIQSKGFKVSIKKNGSLVDEIHISW